MTRWVRIKIDLVALRGKPWSGSPSRGETLPRREAIYGCTSCFFQLRFSMRHSLNMHQCRCALGVCILLKPAHWTKEVLRHYLEPKTRNNILPALHAKFAPLSEHKYFYSYMRFLGLGVFFSPTPPRVGSVKRCHSRLRKLGVLGPLLLLPNIHLHTPAHTCLHMQTCSTHWDVSAWFLYAEPALELVHCVFLVSPLFLLTV